MIKKIFIAILVIAAATAIILSLATISKIEDDVVCSDVKVNIDDNGFSKYISEKEIIKVLERKGIHPIGKKMNSISISRIEKEIGNIASIKSVECYKTTSNNVVIDIVQRIPIMRIINSKGEDFYIDVNAEIIPNRDRILSHSIIATGEISKEYARKELYAFAKFVTNHSFWSAQIEQINVLHNKGVELIPRVGDHIIYLGEMKDYEKKLERLKKFYHKGLNKVGWNKYQRISVEIPNQIICTNK